jgi:hypothetical protein
MRRNSNPSSDADSDNSSMQVAEETGSGSDRLIQWTPFAIALGLVFSMMPDRAEWLYVAAVVGGLASIAVGRTLGRLDPFSLQARVKKFAKGWVVVVALAALSLLHGKWQPMVFFAVVGVISSGLFWFGCKSNK